MSVASVQFYDVVVWVHITAGVLAFGPTFGYAFMQAVAERHDPRSIPTMMRGFSNIDRYLGTPAALVLIAAGLYLTIDRWDFADFYISAGLTAIIVLLGLMHGFFIPHERKLSELAERDIKASGDGEVQLSEEYWVASKRVARVGTLAGLIVILTIYFMSAKPFL